MTKKEKSQSNRKRLILFDAHAILHRAYHALPDFVSSKGEATGGLYGLSSMLLRIIHDLKPDYLAACYDLPEPTYRHEAYAEYKAGRKKADPELISQIIKSRDVFKSFNIPMYDKPGFEADDMLGTIVEKLKDNNDIEIIIASGDMDTLQLVDGDRVKAYTLKKGINDTVMYDEKAVVDRFGFPPKLLPDFKGLRGDPSDNIIGIAGIGEKTASTLLQKFGTIESMYNILKKNPDEFKKEGLTDRIIKLLQDGEEEAEFSKMLATIRRDAPIDFDLPEKTWKETFSKDEVKKFFADLDFRSLSARLDQIFFEAQGISQKEFSLEKESVKEVQKIDEIEFKKTAVALWIINSEITNPTLEDITSFAKIEDFTKASEIIFAELKKRDLEKVFEKIELPLISVIGKIEKRGIKVDTAELKRLSKEYHKELSSIEEKIWEMSGEKFNVSSPKQLGVILFEKMGLKVKNQKKTGGGAKSTKESELEKMTDLHPIIKEVLKYRELSKLLTTYIDSIPDLVAKDGRLHTTLIQTGSTTGRMASQNPNLQNIPIKSELGRNIRKAFIAEKGFSLLSLDYSQMELRIAAFLSKDKKLISIFKEGEDIHTAVASEVFGVPLDKVDKEMRRQAKVINFGIIYGMGVNALRTNLGSDRATAQKFYDDYFKTFSGLAEYLDNVKGEAMRRGYTETLFGRRRYFPGLKSKLPFIKAMAERMAINAPVQGTGADIVKLAMIKVDEFLVKEKLEEKVYPLLQVHDELLYEVQDDVLESIATKIKKVMEDVVPLSETEGIVMKAEAKVGPSWQVMKQL